MIFGVGVEYVNGNRRLRALGVKLYDVWLAEEVAIECTWGERYAAGTEMLGHDSALPQDVAHELAAVGA